MKFISDNKALIGMVIMGLTLAAVAYMGRDCPAPTQVEPETLSQQHGIEEDVALWKAMLEEERRYNNEIHIDIDSLPFYEAFDLMRRMKGKDATFIWHSATYTTLLKSEIPKNWVKSGGDFDDTVYCPENYIDECGVCGGEGLIGWFVDNDGDGIGDDDSMVLTCDRPE